MALKIEEHWAFLDEIEAPMWVDLTVEARGNYDDLDDGWFHTSHMYHQCPSLELKAAFSYSGEGSGSSGFDINGPSSPELPSSVSGSRGKNNRSKRQKEVDYVFPWIKQHPVNVLSGKSSRNAGPRDQIKPKLSFINSKGTWRKKGSNVVERDTIGNAKENNSRVLSCHGDSEGSLSCMEAVGSNTSTITSDNDQKIQPKNLEVSSQAFGHSKGLLSALRTSLRKSRVTRQASRIDVSNRQNSRDSNTVSGNSSVGSSKPSNANKNSTFPLKQNREQTADSRNGARATKVNRSIAGYSASSKVSKIQGKEGTRNSRAGRVSNGSKPESRDATKPKVQNHMVRAKALVPRRVNKQRLSPPVVKAQEMVGGNRLASAVTENESGRVPVNQKGNGGCITTGIMARSQKWTKQEGVWKGNRAKLAGTKENGKHPTITTQSIYIR